MKATCSSYEGEQAEAQEPVDLRQVLLEAGPSPDPVCAWGFDLQLVLRWCGTPRSREDPGVHLLEEHPHRLWEWRLCDAPTDLGFSGSSHFPPPVAPPAPACCPSW